MFTRDDPSQRQRELWELYSRLHESGEAKLGLTPGQTYPGVSLLPHLERVRRLVRLTGAGTLLDYGAGKGMQYSPGLLDPERYEGHDCVLDYWDVDSVHCYDPCYAPFRRRPSGKFHGVITTDVLEHCAETDIPWIVEELFDFAERFVFACIACYPAKTTLPNGENAHCTQRTQPWWEAQFRRAAERNPAVVYEAWVHSLVPGSTTELEESSFGSARG